MVVDIWTPTKVRPVQAGDFLRRLLASRNPEAVRVAHLCLWKLQPANAQLREQAIKAVVEAELDVSAVGTMERSS